MRIVVIGNRKLTRYLLQWMIKRGWDVEGVIAPDPASAATQANFVPFDNVVDGADFSIHETQDINSAATIKWLRSHAPDLCICGGWAEIIDSEVRKIPSAGFLGFHSSRLPKGRGGAPVNWRIIEGAETISLSLFHYTSGVDAGDIVAQRAVTIEERDDVATVFEKLSAAACRTLEEIEDDIEKREIAGEPQSLEEATYRPRRQPQDGLIDWDRSPSAQMNWIRAQTDPYPGAYTFYNGVKLTVWEGKALDRTADCGVPGELLEVHDGEGIDIRTGDGVIRITRVQPDDSPSCWADTWASEMDIVPGDRLGTAAAPATWMYTGIRGPVKRTQFVTNLAPDETGRLDALAISKATHDVRIHAALNGNQIIEENATLTGEWRKPIFYAPTATGTHTLAVQFDIDDKHSDTRYLKVFVSD